MTPGKYFRGEDGEGSREGVEEVLAFTMPRANSLFWLPIPIKNVSSSLVNNKCHVAELSSKSQS